jgi:signal transduction histidine kinase
MRAWGSRRTLLDRLRLDGATIRGSQHAIQSELITILNEVADAVSSAMSVDAVLKVIVDRAKRITDTDKAMLVLFDEHGQQLDLDTIVVRGRRDQHLQEWWQSRLELLSERLFTAGEPLVEEHPAEHAWLMCCPILVQGKQIGLLGGINRTEHPFTQLQRDFYAILSAFAASAIENARLAEESRYVLLASERDRIAREMHDGVVQSLFSISLGLELCKKQIKQDPDLVAVRLDELQEHLNISMTELRRFIYDLRPMKLSELGLVGAVEYWVREITQGRPIRGRVVVEEEMPRMSPAEEAILYRVAKEGVSNAVRHSGARSLVVHITASEGSVGITITDDGDGFDAKRVMNGGATGIGLKSISESIQRHGGTFTLDSRPGSGTCVAAEVPVGGAR